MGLVTGEEGNMELCRDKSESLRDAGGESISGDWGGEYKEDGCFGGLSGDACGLLPRRAWHVGHSLTNREISSFGTLYDVHQPILFLPQSRYFALFFLPRLRS